MRISIWQWVTLYAVVLAVEAIALFFFENRLNLVEASWRLLVAYLVGGLVSALLLTVALVILYRGLSRLWRKSLSRVTLFTVRRAAKTSSRKVVATGIGSRGGELILSLSIGIQGGITRDAKFWATTATGERLGIVECIEVSESSCLCVVFAILNEDFWTDLDARKNRDPSPPLGVDFVGYIPEGFLVDVQRLLTQWEVSK